MRLRKRMAANEQTEQLFNEVKQHLQNEQMYNAYLKSRTLSTSILKEVNENQEETKKLLEFD